MKLILVSLISTFLILTSSHSIIAQKYFTRQGNISFHSDALLEKIEAHNSTATLIIDLETGTIQAAILIKAFKFKKALMQTHFNENYMESHKFPKAEFSGQFDPAHIAKIEGPNPVTLPMRGSINIHGISRELEGETTFEAKDGRINGSTSFQLVVSDFDIKIPSIVRDNIAKTIDVVVEVSLEKLNR